MMFSALSSSRLLRAASTSNSSRSGAIFARRLVRVGRGAAGVLARAAFALGAALLALAAGFAADAFAAARFEAGLTGSAFGVAFALAAAAAFGLALALALVAALGFGAAATRRFGLSSAGVGLRAMAASSCSIHHGCNPAALIAVAEAAFSRAGTKHHLAGLVARLAPASNAPGRQRWRRSTEAAAPRSA